MLKVLTDRKGRSITTGQRLFKKFPSPSEMTFKSFIFGLLASFGIPWLAVVVFPFSKMRALGYVAKVQETEEKDEGAAASTA